MPASNETSLNGRMIQRWKERKKERKKGKEYKIFWEGWKSFYEGNEAKIFKSLSPIAFRYFVFFVSTDFIINISGFGVWLIFFYPSIQWMDKNIRTASYEMAS